MKSLNDCSHFDADQPPLTWSNGSTRLFYRSNRRSFRVAGLNMGAKNRELLHCGSVRWAELLPGTHFRRENPADLSVEYLRSGTLQFRQEGRGYELTAGEVFLFFPGMAGDFYAVCGECEKVSIIINGKLLGAYLEMSGLVRNEALSGINTVRLERLIREFEALSGRHGVQVERENGFLTWRFLDFLRHPLPSPQLPPQLAACETVCREHLGDPLFSVEELARKCSLSTSHFIRLFRRHFGETPYRYLVRLRMGEAARLLIATELPSVKQVAANVGYRNALNFSTEFRKFFGLSPSQYAERERL